MRYAFAAMCMSVFAMPAFAQAGGLPGTPAGARNIRTTPFPFEGMRVSRNFRVRLTLVDATATPPVEPADDRLRERLSGAMFDFYPDASGGGFHLSAGLHYYVRRNPNQDAFNATHGLLFLPRGRGAGYRSGFRRYTPAATLGYTQPVGNGFAVGVESGAMLGPALNSLPFAAHERAGVNPVTSLIVGFRF